MPRKNNPKPHKRDRERNVVRGYRRIVRELALKPKRGNWHHSMPSGKLVYCGD